MRNGHPPIPATTLVGVLVYLLFKLVVLWLLVH